MISFHSLEDRIVKTMFKQQKYSRKGTKELANSTNGGRKAPFQLVNKKPILPSIEEITENSRSQSAKLRVIERVKIKG